MKSIADQTRLTQAWLNAWQLRCCPPDSILTGKAADKELYSHLALCPVCSAKRNDPLPEIRINGLPEPAAGNRNPQAGELWTVAPEMGGWGGKSRYYAPPVVLVTGLVDNRAVAVVQTCSDCTLAAADDILLDNELIGFAQPWNRYTLAVNDLAFCIGRVSGQLVEQVGAAVQTEARESGLQLQPGSLLWFFRNMEVETGWFFARKSIAGLLGSRESSSDHANPENRIDLAALRTDLLARHVLVAAAPDADSIEQLLATTMPDTELLSLAAAGAEPRNIPVLLFYLDQGRVEEIKTVFATLTHYEEQDRVIMVSGTCASCPEQECDWFFRWKVGNLFRRPLPGQYGMEDGVFWAVFPVDPPESDDSVDILLAGEADNEPGELVIRVLVHR
jgi:hypothetical protein